MHTIAIKLMLLGIKKYIVGLIIKLSSDADTLIVRIIVTKSDKIHLMALFKFVTKYLDCTCLEIYLSVVKVLYYQYADFHKPNSYEC